ncbi:double zinc ribbon domain-containing protein [Aliiroseovarius sp. YM-037]|uniref:double zinc ribbon domain-containing protein n=1 Tax=Aliiroseovarius sp. YM-037 TaxID=3341728 RepID=UPI003A80E2F5
MQSALRMIFPPQCMTCGVLVDSEFGLCSTCWRDTPFVFGLVCDKCGLPLPGEEADSSGVLCDDCLRIARPWVQGRAALLYAGNARRLVLALKHGDRQELARPAAEWMARVAEPILSPDMLIAPVPLHWTRLARRRYNQAALLAQRLAARTGLDCEPTLLQRKKRTKPMEGVTRDARFALLQGAITCGPQHANLTGRDVLLVDDVMTSGATLAASAEACIAAGARQVSVLTLARVAKDA